MEKIKNNLIKRTCFLAQIVIYCSVDVLFSGGISNRVNARKGEMEILL